MKYESNRKLSYEKTSNVSETDNDESRPLSCMSGLSDQEWMIDVPINFLIVHSQNYQPGSAVGNSWCTIYTNSS